MKKAIKVLFHYEFSGGRDYPENLKIMVYFDDGSCEEFFIPESMKGMDNYPVYRYSDGNPFVLGNQITIAVEHEWYKDICVYNANIPRGIFTVLAELGKHWTADVAGIINGEVFLGNIREIPKDEYARYACMDDVTCWADVFSMLTPERRRS